MQGRRRWPCGGADGSTGGDGALATPATLSSAWWMTVCAQPSMARVDTFASWIWSQPWRLDALTDGPEPEDASVKESPRATDCRPATWTSSRYRARLPWVCG